jgi:hypothetical protein
MSQPPAGEQRATSECRATQGATGRAETAAASRIVNHSLSLYVLHRPEPLHTYQSQTWGRLVLASCRGNAHTRPAAFFEGVDAHASHGQRDYGRRSVHESV